MGDQDSVILAEQAIRCSLVILYYSLEPCKLNLKDTIKIEIEIQIKLLFWFLFWKRKAVVQ